MTCFIFAFYFQGMITPNNS